MKAVSWSTRIPLFEIDIGGGVYHGNYFHLFEQAREAFFREVGYPYSHLVNKGLHLTMAEININYHKPLRYDETVSIQTELVALRPHSLHLYQEIIRDNNICTEARFTMVLVDSAGKAVKLPEEFRLCLKPIIGN